jgi:hypothetical protein
MESRKRLNVLSPGEVSLQNCRRNATAFTVSKVGCRALVKEQGLLQVAQMGDILGGAAGARRIALVAILNPLALRVAIGACALCVCLENGPLSHGF